MKLKVLFFIILIKGLLAQETMILGLPNRTNNPEKSMKLFQLVIDILNKNSKFTWQLEIYENDEELMNALVKNKVNIIKTGALFYSIQKQKHNIQAIAVSLNKNNLPYYTSSIVVYKKSPIKNLMEVKNKKFAFGSKYSSSLFLVAALYMEKIGIPLRELDYAFLGKQSKILLSLQKGVYDAGAVITDLLNNVRPGTFKELYRSDPIPGSPFIINKTMPKGKVEKLLEDLQNYTRYVKNHPDEVINLSGDFRFGFTIEVNENRFEPLRMAYKNMLPKIK